MPLVHQDGPDLHRPVGATLQPVETASREAGPRVAETYSDDPAVAAAEQRLAELEAANASPALLTRAARDLSNARLDVEESRARLNAQRRAEAHAAAADLKRQEIEREIQWRLSEASPRVLIEVGGFRIVVRPERPPEQTGRAFAAQDIVEALQILHREADRAAGAARKGSPYVTDDGLLLRELQDRMRRSISLGATKVTRSKR